MSAIGVVEELGKRLSSSDVITLVVKGRLVKIIRLYIDVDQRMFSDSDSRK